MKILLKSILIPILFVSCGDSKTAKNDTNDKMTINKELSKNDAGDENKKVPELFVYDGEYFNALKLLKYMIPAESCVIFVLEMFARCKSYEKH